MTRAGLTVTLVIAACPSSSSNGTNGSFPIWTGAGTGTTSGGLSCAPNQGSCASQACCAGLACDPLTLSCFQPHPADGGPAETYGCRPNPLGGPCVTAADCQPGLACAGDGGTGTCSAGLVVSQTCLSAGQPCDNSPLGCCAGTCANHVCTGNWAPCGPAGSPCALDTDCCLGDHLACALDGGAGTCVNACHLSGDACETSSDCCEDLGIFCYQLPPRGGVCAFAAGPACVRTLCESLDSGMPQCALGAPCAFTPTYIEIYGTDPCFAAGLNCDPNTSVCAAPVDFRPCLPGGPACSGVPASSLAHESCEVIGIDLDGGIDGGGALLFACVQPCKEDADCLVPYDYCGPSRFDPNFAQCALTSCSAVDQPCSNVGSFTGTCVDANGQHVDVCLQGGSLSVGDSCDARSRQQGSFCGTDESCVDRICRAVCDVTNGNANCAAGELCVTDFHDVAAGCAPGCDYGTPDASVCGALPGAPQRCYVPVRSPGLADNPQGFCAAASANPLPLGAACPISDSIAWPDPCVSGSDCLGGVCTQTCEGVGGQSTCSTGTVCTSLAPLFSRPLGQYAGFCAQMCDYTSTDPSTCPPTAGGVPQRCYATIDYGLPDGPQGICGGASTSLALGATCAEPLYASPDPCATGEVCYGTCRQVCRGVGAQSGCPTGQMCMNAASIFFESGVEDTQFGFCQ